MFPYLVRFMDKKALSKADLDAKVALNVWYPLLQNQTYATTFLPLSRAEGQALLNLSPMMAIDYTAHDEEILQAFETKLKAIMNDLTIFAKLNTRSPKDVIYDAYYKPLVNPTPSVIDSFY